MLFRSTGIFAATPFINADAEKIMKEIPFPPIPASEAAARILDGVRRNQAVISFPGYARFLWRLYRWWPGVLNVLGRKQIRDLRRARKVR